MQEGGWNQGLGEGEIGREGSETGDGGVGGDRFSLGRRVGFDGRDGKFFALCKCLIIGQVKATQNGCE